MRVAVPGLALLLMATACSARALGGGPSAGEHYFLTEGVRYGPGERHLLDVYRPRHATHGAPVVVFIYGGRWRSGERGQYRLLGDALTRRGYVVVVPDYRLAPGARFPAWVSDAADAVRWTSEHIASFGGDGSRLFIVGHSAGAHTATLLALDQSHLLRAGVPTGSIAGVVSIAGPVYTEWTDPDVQEAMGAREQWPASYPATHLGGGSPPLLLLHGSADRTVSPANSLGLAERIRESGGCARAVIYPGVGHVEIVLALIAPWLFGTPVTNDVEAFARRPSAYARCP